MTDRSAFSPWDEARARAVISALQDLPGACLPVLHALQAEFGYIHAEAIPLVAEALVLSRADCSYRRMFEGLLDERGVARAAGVEFSSAAALRGSAVATNRT